VEAVVELLRTLALALVLAPPLPPAAAAPDPVGETLVPPLPPLLPAIAVVPPRSDVPLEFVEEPLAWVSVPLRCVVAPDVKLPVDHDVLPEPVYNPVCPTAPASFTSPTFRI